MSEYHLHITLSNGSLSTDPNTAKKLCELKDGDKLKVRANPSKNGFSSDAEITKIEFFSSSDDKSNGIVAATYDGTACDVTVNGSDYSVKPGTNKGEQVAYIEAKTTPSADDDAWYKVYIGDGDNSYSLDPEIVNTSDGSGWKNS
jgi:hypothetical protein